MEIILSLLGLAAGIALLVWSADVFVDGSAAFAKRCGMSSLLIGMIIIGFGTSMPEMLVSVLAAVEGSPSIALGNAYGSNTANIGLILGLTAAIAPIAVAKGVLRRELPVLIAITLICGALLLDGAISRLDAVIMLVLFAGFLVNNILREAKAPEEGEGEGEGEGWTAKNISLKKSILMILAGLTMLVVSSRLLVVCAVRIASALGVPDLVIGLTIVAIGTSLPELASSLAAIKKNEHDLALGNIVGSNFFNTLAVVGLACVISPMTADVGKDAVLAILHRDYPVVIAMTFFLLLCCIPLKKGKQAKIYRSEGILLLSAFIVYLGWLVYASMK